jgi:class 3 adenylate cyclase
MAMMKSLEKVNHSNQSGSNLNFKLRVGISIGPVIAGGIQTNSF